MSDKYKHGGELTGGGGGRKQKDVESDWMNSTSGSG